MTFFVALDYVVDSSLIAVSLEEGWWSRQASSIDHGAIRIGFTTGSCEYIARLRLAKFGLLSECAEGGKQ